MPKKLGYMEDAEVLQYGIGMSNIVPRTTRSANELSRSGNQNSYTDYFHIMYVSLMCVSKLVHNLPCTYLIRTQQASNVPDCRRMSWARMSQTS